MPISYLESDDYSTYGLAEATTSSQVILAGEIIDNYLSRNEGLIYVPDINGLPLYMQKPVAQFTLTLTQDLSPGKNVIVTVSGTYPSIRMGLAGIINVDNSTCEALIVVAVNGNALTIANVNNSHVIGETIEFGLLIEEQLDMPTNRSLTNLGKWPIMNVIALHGRYGYTRGYNPINSLVDDLNILSELTAFGGPPAWEICTATPDMYDPYTGQFWAPAGIMNAYFSQLRVQYVAGYTYANLPSAIKMACARIITNINDQPANASFKSMQAGDQSMVRFNNTIIDQETKTMLQPFSVRLFV